jgi:hypothetical protein
VKSYRRLLSELLSQVERLLAESQAIHAILQPRAEAAARRLAENGSDAEVLETYERTGAVRAEIFNVSRRLLYSLDQMGGGLSNEERLLVQAWAAAPAANKLLALQALVLGRGTNDGGETHTGEDAAGTLGRVDGG